MDGGGNQGASGTLRLKVGAPISCDTGTKGWSATTTAAPPDTTPPDTTITASPPEATTDTTPSFEFTATEAGSTFRCRIDQGAFAPCTSPYAAPVQATGSHRFDVQAVDAAGNADASPASRAFMVTTGATTALNANLSAASRQRVLARRGVTVTLLCQRPGCTAELRGSVRIAGGSPQSLKRATRTLVAGKRLTVRLGYSAKLGCRIRRALTRRAKVTATIRATFRAGTATRTATVTVRIAR